MKLSDFCKGLEVLLPYYDGDGHHLGADHDVIYLYPTSRPLPPHDVARLRELGFFQEGHSEEPDYYDPESSWWAFV